MLDEREQSSRYKQVYTSPPPIIHLQTSYPPPPSHSFIGSFFIGATQPDQFGLPQ